MKQTKTLILFAIIIIAALLLNNRNRTSGSNMYRLDKNISMDYDTNDILTSVEMKSYFEKLGLGRHWNKFEPLLKNEIRIFTKSAENKELKIGQSKFGGRPDLPKNTEWFKEDNGMALSFVAQINLREIQKFDLDNVLPDSGIIYFFYSATQEAWGFDPKDKDKFKVFYSTLHSDLERKDFPHDLDGYSRFTECELSFKNTVGLPSWENDFVQEHLTDEEIDLYLRLPEDYTINKILGYSNNIQNEMELECQLVTNGFYCGDATGYNDSKAKELEKGVGDWVLLFQIDSEDEKTGMMWGDVGRLYFWIRKQDLVKRNFDGAWMILQCT